MKNNDIILYAGKTLGNLVLNYMIKYHQPEYLIPNLDDNGKDNTLHESTIKIAKNNGVKIINNKKLIKLCKKKNN
jgi:type III secretion system FlhB-like substrate exporter